MNSNVYMAKINQLTRSNKTNQEIRNPERTYEALKCIGIQAVNVAQAEYVVDLFQDLKTKDTPLRNVTNLCETICRDIKPQQKKQLI